MAFSARISKPLPQIADSKLAVWRTLLRPLTIRAVPPRPPANFQVTNVRGGIALSWSPLQTTSGPQNPDGYELIRSQDGSFTGDIQVIPLKDLSQTSYFDPFPKATTAYYRIRGTAGTQSTPQGVRGPESGALSHTSLDPSDTSSTSSTKLDVYTSDKVAATARFGNYGSISTSAVPTLAGFPSSGAPEQPVAPPGSPRPLAPGSTSFANLTSGTSLGQTFIISTGAILEATDGVINATEVNGIPIAAGTAATVALQVPITDGVGGSAWAILTKPDLPATTVYTDQANTFGAFVQKFKSGADFVLSDPTDVTKTSIFDLSHITTGTQRTVNVPDAASTAAQANTGTTHQFFTSMSAQGVFSLAQPAFADISGSAAGTQIFPHFTVAGLPGSPTEGSFAYATNGRKVGEGAGSGTGVPVYFSNTQWRVFSTDAQVTA